ncbi:MAG: cupin domain-containing protein [Theionarchaea archaeon]|nr:cupin domain-containing protein [Theionarchaea archaeon]
MKESKYFVNAEDISGIKKIPERTSKLLISGKTHGATNLSMGMAIVPSGSEIPWHEHPEQQEVMMVVEGKGRAIIGDEEEVVTPGSTFFVPEGIRHRVQSIGNGDLKIVWCYSPPLKEHLGGD